MHCLPVGQGVLHFAKEIFEQIKKNTIQIKSKGEKLRKAHESPCQSDVQVQMSGAATQVPPFLQGGVHTGVEQVGPVQDEVHEQVSGAMQVPEFWHVLLQTAVQDRKVTGENSYLKTYGIDNYCRPSQLDSCKS